jgi:hypothetical protein
MYNLYMGDIMPSTQVDVIEARIEDAVRILTHYVMMALPDADKGDTQAEMRDIVRSIVDAAVMSSKL